MWYRFIDTLTTPSKRLVFFYLTTIHESQAPQFIWRGVSQSADVYEAGALPQHDVKCRVFVLHAIIAQHWAAQIQAEGIGSISISGAAKFEVAQEFLENLWTSQFNI